MEVIKPKVIESMHVFKFPGMTVRVWREETEILDEYDGSYLEKEARALYPKGTAAVAWSLLIRDRVNAVECLKSNGKGVILYREWP